MRASLIPCLALAMIAMQSNAFGEPQTKENSKGKTIEVSNLMQNPDETCQQNTFDGQIVKRDFAKDAVRLEGITLEGSDGARTFINVEVPSDLSMNLLGRVVDGLQRLSKVGRHAKGRAYRCGVSGHVLVLDEIR